MPNIDYCHASMGAMIFAFQELEHELVNVLINLIDAPSLQLIGILETRISFGKAMDVLSAVTKQKVKSKKLSPRIEVLIKRAREFAKKRNMYVHSHYDLTEMSGYHVRFERSKGKFNGRKDEPAHETFKPDDLFNLANAINKRVNWVMSVHDHIKDEICPGWRDDEFLQEYENDEVPREIVERFFRNLDLGSGPEIS
jgi:hypothetical protein